MCLRNNDIALTQPKIVTCDGRPRDVPLPIAEYERLKQHDQQPFMAADTPDEFLPAIEALGIGKA